MYIFKVESPAVATFSNAINLADRIRRATTLASVGARGRAGNDYNQFSGYNRSISRAKNFHRFTASRAKSRSIKIHNAGLKRGPF